MAKLTALLSLNTAHFQAGLKNAAREIGAFKKNVDGASGMGKGFAGIGTALGASIAAGVAVAGASIAVVGKSIASAADFEQTKVAFTTLIGDAGKAEETLAKLRQLGAETPFEFPELADAGRKLIAFGESADSVPETLRRIGDVSAGIQAPVNEIAELYGKARVQGRLFAEDINQLTGRGIPIIGELAKQFGVSDSEVKKLVESGQVGFPAIEQAFISMTSKGGQFSGMMQAQSQTTKGLFSTLKDTVNEAFLALGQPINDAIGPMLQEAIKFAGELAPMAAEAGKAIKDAVQFTIATFKSGRLLELVGSALQLAFVNSVNFLWAMMRGVIAAIGQMLVESFRTAIMWFEVLTTADFWKGMGNAVIGIFLDAVAYLQKGIANALEVFRPLAELLGQGDTLDWAQGNIRETAGMLESEAKNRYGKAKDQLAPTAEKIATRFKEASENISTRFQETVANTPDVINASGYREKFANTVQSIRDTMPQEKPKEKPKEKPAPVIAKRGNDEAKNRTTLKAHGIGNGDATQLGAFAQSMNALFGRSANAGLIDENKRQTAWLEKIFENTKPKKDVKPNLEAIFA